MRRIVLIVEDSEQCAVMLEIALRGADLECFCVNGGYSALEFLDGAEGGEVCAILTDLNMPGMDGFDLIRNLRADGRYQELPIIALSGNPDPQTPGRTRALGADAFFSKPFSPIQVRAKLEQLLHACQT